MMLLNQLIQMIYMLACITAQINQRSIIVAKSHKYFSEDKYHLHLKIKSTYLQSITRINAQKQIMNVLKDELNTTIHALEISIE